MTARTLSEALDAIRIIKGRLTAAPGDPIPPLPHDARAADEAALERLMAALAADHVHEIELRRQAALQRLHQAAYLRISRSDLTRGIIERNSGWPLRLAHQSGDHGIVISITHRLGFFRNGVQFPCRLGQDSYLIQITEPADIARPVTGFESGQATLDFLRHLEEVRIDPNR